LARVQAALIEERYLKKLEMENYEKRVKQSITIEMDIMMAKMKNFFDEKTKQFDERDSTNRLFHEILKTPSKNTERSMETININVLE